MKFINVIKLLGCIALCELAGIIGSVFTFQSVATWFPTLQKPFFSPPNWIFGPVWTTLYLLMGVALYLIWTSAKNNKFRMKAFVAFGIQLILNTFWSIIFFGLHSTFYAVLELVLLCVMIVVTIQYFWKIKPLAAKLLLPYLAWCSFALILNFAIWQLN